MKSCLHNKPLTRANTHTTEDRNFVLEEWIDRELALLEEKHSEFVTRDSLARHFSAEKSSRR